MLALLSFFPTSGPAPAGLFFAGSIHHREMLSQVCDDSAALEQHHRGRRATAISHDVPVLGTGFYNPHLDEIATSDVPFERNVGEFLKVRLPPRLVLLKRRVCRGRRLVGYPPFPHRPFPFWRPIGAEPLVSAGES